MKINQIIVQIYQQVDPELTELNKNLTAAIAEYNFEQPKNEFINWMHNKLPYTFLFDVVGNSKTVIEVYYRNESRRAAKLKMIECEEF